MSGRENLLLALSKIDWGEMVSKLCVVVGKVKLDTRDKSSRVQYMLQMEFIMIVYRPFKNMSVSPRSSDEQDGIQRGE